ncbi:AEC family transporter [Acinetobacter sp. Ver3]|uniref:AEC family transporter n=1 Tax=Acinetobacter sp. Ver3 TaxID=466088 RepID=UPI00044EAE26|nr:AEC family transporter [Acinetobacter sp. Ver3]EZQ01009.1 transporter [Acinetobacter sp. Ver3]
MVLSVILPIFLLLFSGYASVKLNLLSKEQVSIVGTFVIRVALPALFLQALSSKDLDAIWQPELFYSYIVVTAFVFAIALGILVKHFKNNLSDAAILSIGASMSNTGLLGTAILSLLIGHIALAFTSLIVIIESVFLVPAALFIAGLQAQNQQAVLNTLKNNFINLCKNPLFIGVVIGILCAVFQVKLPHYIDQVFLMIGQTASPLALFVIGGSVAGLTLKYVNQQSLYIVLSSNFIFPIFMYLTLRFIAQAPMDIVYVGTLIAALPTPALFGMLGQAYGLNDRAITPLLMSTVIGFIVTAGLIILWW